MMLFAFQGGAFTFDVQYADAVTRDEVNAIQSSINTLESGIIRLDNEIIDIRITILNNDKLIDVAKENLRKAKDSSSTSWSAVVDINNAETKLTDAQTNYNESRDKLFTLLRDKSDAIKALKLLNIQIQDDNTTLKTQGNADLSHLVKKIGLINSNVCITMNKAGINSTCPDYKDFILLDTSNTDISGKFTTDDDGYFHRDLTAMKNSYRAYDFDNKLHLFIDPPREMISRIKLIEIRPNFDTYMDHSKLAQFQEFQYIDYKVNQTIGDVTQVKTIQVLNQTQDYGRILYHDRYANESCTHIIINADKLQILLADTIHYVRNNCDERFTGYVTKEIIPINATYQDITTSQKYKDDKRLEFIKEFCIFKYKSCPNDAAN